MAHVSILDDAVGAVASEDMAEGSFVVLTASGMHHDLPTATPADAGTVTGVFMVFATPDRFPRPTPNGMFQYNDTLVGPDPRNATERTMTHDDENAWLIGPSVLPKVTIRQGWKVACHRGGYYELQPGEFNDSNEIRVTGAAVAVGANGLATYTAISGTAVGAVREYNVKTGALTISVKEL